MIVVSNTSPLTNLAAIGQFGLLQQLYSRLHIARGVALIQVLRRDLDQGEAESIALALELETTILLIDEREGRHSAQQLGLRVVAVVGILLDAKAQGLVDQVVPHLDRLRQHAGFYLSWKLYQRVRALAGES